MVGLSSRHRIRTGGGEKEERTSDGKRGQEDAVSIEKSGNKKETLCHIRPCHDQDNDRCSKQRRSIRSQMLISPDPNSFLGAGALHSTSSRLEARSSQKSAILTSFMVSPKGLWVVHWMNV